MNPKLKKWLAYLLGPSAFKLGLLITLAFIVISRSYYDKSESRTKTWINERLTTLHQDSIDVRMKLRGPRPPSPDVAIVAVDETAVQQLGRWPWPRGRIAEMIEKLVGYGAKVIGFDAVFSEPDNNQAVISLGRLKQTNLATGPLATLLEKEIASANSDDRLAQTIEKFGDKVVIGNFFDELGTAFAPYQELCVAAILDGTPEAKLLEKEEKPLAVNDSADFTLPEPWREGVKGALEDFRANLTKQFEGEGRSQAEINNALIEAQLQYCSRWLSKEDEYLDHYRGVWAEHGKTVEDWSNLNFDQAADKIMYEARGNRVRALARLVMNLPDFAAKSKHSGYFSAHLDEDGTIRRTKLMVRYGSTYIPSLALKSILVAKKLNALAQIEPNPQDPNFKIVTGFTLINDETGDEVGSIPTDHSGQLLLNYAGSNNMFPHVSVFDVLSDKDTAEINVRDGNQILPKIVNKKEFFKDKIIIFGATATGIYDLRVTPFSENYPGVETHANAVDNMLRGDYLKPVGLEYIYMEWALIVIGLSLSFVLTHLGAVFGLLLTALTLAGTFLVDKFLLFGAGHVVSIIIPLIFVSALYVSLTFYKYFTEERHKKAIKGTFEKYVSPAIVAEVLKDPSNLQLGGRKQRMTVLFSDVRGFTTISEKLDPQALSAMLNSYLTPMTELVFKNKGTLDKYMGDAIMAFFGAPIHYDDHAKSGVQCALDMMSLLPKLNDMLAQKGLPPIDVGIGLNTGDMSVGNMGSETVRSYTVMGDAVNLGSRLEGINKQYGTHIIVSEFTYNDIKNDFVCREVDWVRVKGKLQPVKIYEVISKKTDVVKSPEMLSFFEKGSAEYHLQNWDTAIDCFSKALNIDPEDEPSKLFLQRATTYKEEPPPKDWDGVFEMKTK